MSHVCLAASLLIVFSASPAQAALWYESYESAQTALDEGNWTEAIRQIELARDEKSDSSARARTYGMNFTSYFPYLKLGIAYYHLGQLDGALQLFETEENMGAIVDSEDDYAELKRIRGLIEQARTDAVAAEQTRIRQVVTNNLDDARRLEGEGRFEDALSALGKALSVAPDDSDATTLRQQLLGRIAAEQERQDRQQRAGQLVRQGRTQLGSGQFQEAASTFSRALDIDSAPETRRLLDQAQEGLRAELAAQQDEQLRRTSIADGLRRAAEFETGGEFIRALDELQTVLALDPKNSQAKSLGDRIIKAQARADERSARNDAVGGLLAEAESLLEAGDYDGAARSANRVLALEPNNSDALGYVARVYTQMSRGLLVTDNPRPILLFDDQRAEQDDGSRVERLDTADFLLSGRVLDNTAVRVSFFRGDTLIETGSTIRSQEFQGINMTDFRLRSRMPPGPSTIRVVAADEGGEEVTSEYDVVYAVPFFRTRWFQASSVAAVLAIVAVIALIRIRRRRHLLTRRFNPYIAGAPILADQNFFGRERLLDYVLQRVHNNSILLYGERRIGKTSFQHRLKKRLMALRDPNYTFYAAFIDLQGTPEERFFATMAEGVFDDLAPYLDGVEPDSALHDGDYRYRSFVLDMQRVLKKLKTTSDRTVKLVLLIDEVDELNSYDPRVNQKLRSLFMKTFAENLVTVVSGVGIKKTWEREGSPWYNFFQEIEVKPFRREDAEELIEVPIRGTFRLEDGVTANIIDRTECKPYLIQKLCASLVERLHDDKRRRITLSDVEEVSRIKGAQLH